MANQSEATLELSGPAAGPSEAAFNPFRIVFFVALWTLLMLSTIGTFVQSILPGGWLAVALLFTVLMVPAFAFVRSMTLGNAPSAFTRLFVIRPFWYAQLTLPLLAGAGLVGALIGWPFGMAVMGGQWAVLGVGTVFLLMALVGWVGSRRLQVRHFSATFDTLPPALDGLRIAQISDLHVGPHTSKRFMKRIADAVEASEPDLIAITGDQVDDYVDDVRHFEAAFGHLNAPLGVFAVAGNHDVYAGWAGVEKGLREMGMRVLVNEAEAVEYNGTRFWVAGTGDPAGQGWSRTGGRRAAPDIAKTMADVPEGGFSVVLAHNPALWPALVQQGANVTLSGHTHYGQFSLPRFRWSLASPFLDLAMGEHRQGESWLYINPGTNFWGLPFRIGALPEVTVVTLRRHQ